MAEDSPDKSQSESRSASDATGDFFSVGVPLHAVRAGYVRRRADDQLFEALTAGRYAHIVAPDRSGKSSLIAATTARLESKGRKVAILDLEQIGDRDGGTESGRWYYSVVYRLLRQLRIRYDLQSWWQDKSILSNRQRLFEFYSEVILQHVDEPVVVFVDEIQCIEKLDYADQLLTSIRAAHNARTTDPDFSRLTFVLLGECDPVSLMQEAELSPFNVTLPIVLDDFSRQDLDIFSTELNLGIDDARLVLDRIFFWTSGQPYLTQKLARAVARDSGSDVVDDIEVHVDRLATMQLIGRAALHNEPHMSHIHRAIANDQKRREGLLNLYGKIRKGIDVPADLGSALQRRLIAVGLLVVDAESNISVRNRAYAAVFTARWANENLPTQWKVPSMVAAGILLFALIPFWYTQWLPTPYVRALVSDGVELSEAMSAYENYRSFPGHSDTADVLYRRFLERRANATTDENEIRQLATIATELPNSGRLGDEFEAGFWDRKMRAALREEDRDTALLASLRSLILATPLRRQRAASLVADDYPNLLSTLPESGAVVSAFDPVAVVLTTALGSTISQHTHTAQGVQRRDDWTVTALDVTPLVRRVIIDREGTVGRIGLTLNISHGKLSDLRIKIIAPSGRTVEIETGLERASSVDDIRIPSAQLQELLGESLSGTWSISVRDENLGVAGQLVGWNLKLNSQGAVEYFQRGLNIPDPVERETDNIWFDTSGRYAVARAEQSDSARIWDLAFAEPLRAVALAENETLIGLDASARRLITASQDKVNLWDTTSGDKVLVLNIEDAAVGVLLTSDRTRLFVERRGDIESRLQLWSLDDGYREAEIRVAGVPAQVAIDSSGNRIAIADFDRAVRVWDSQSGELLGQFDLPFQAGSIELSADGSTLAVVYPNAGISIWSVENSQQPLLQEFGEGRWKTAFSPSGNLFAAGRPETGFQVHTSANGSRIGPPLGVRSVNAEDDLLAFSEDEQLLLTGAADGAPRMWRVPVANIMTASPDSATAHAVWSPAADRQMLVSPNGSFLAIGDPDGHLHFMPASATVADLKAVSDDVSFVGHSSAIIRLATAFDESLVASISADNSLRLWRPESGEPLAIAVEISGPVVEWLAVSPSGGYVAALSNSQLSLLSVADGKLIAEFASNSEFSGLTFGSDEQLYVGAKDGSLQLLSQNVDGHWGLQQVWQGATGIQLLKASPRGDFLVLVDQDNLASQFLLDDGKLGEGMLQLPSPVQEVAFDITGTRAHFRTARWVHRASSSALGLVWMDAIFVPRNLHGAAMVHGDGSGDEHSRHRMYLPVGKNGFVELLELGTAGVSDTGLFGSRAELLQEWGSRLSADLPAEF